jgi:hypothetical protein
MTSKPQKHIEFCILFPPLVLSGQSFLDLPPSKIKGKHRDISRV